MRIYNNLFFLGLLFIAACSSNKVPDGIIPQKEMTSLLAEVHIVDGSLYTVSQAPDTLYKHGMGRYLELFKRYGTDTLQFKKSMEYYTADPDKMETMYTQILETMTAKSDSLNKVRVKVDAAKADSVQKANKKALAHKTDSLNKIKKEIKK
jgi:Domain of unknown function (DUF4296)